MKTGDRKTRAYAMREERRKHLLKFIEKKKARIISHVKEEIPLMENRKGVPNLKREVKPKEFDRTYINGSSRRKKRREKLLELSLSKEELKKDFAVAALEEKQKRQDERKKEREEKIALKRAEASRRAAERNSRKLEELKKREELAALRKKAKEEEVIRKGGRPQIPPEKNVKPEPPQVPAEARIHPSINTKEELLSFLKSKKEKQALEYNQRLIRKQAVLAEKRLSAVRKKEERQKQKFEATRKKEEASVRKAGKPVTVPLTAHERPQVPVNKRKEELLEFIRGRKLLNEQRRESKVLLKEVSAGRRVGVEEKPGIAEIPAIIPAVPMDRKTASYLSGLTGEAKRIDTVEARNAVVKSVDSSRKFIAGFSRKAIAPAKVPVAQARKLVAKYKEPFLLVPFIRRNAFRFVFLILLMAWLAEMFLLVRKFQNPQQRLAGIVGEEVFTSKSPEEVTMPEKVPVPEQMSISYKPERIDIEGKRDPFSPGRLTMEVLNRPAPTNIVLAPKPEIISILRPRVVSIIKEEKQMEPEKVSSVSKPQTPSYQTILKASPRSEVASQPITPLEKVSKPEVSPLIVPEKRCDLIYRGRILIEGVEYLFIEGQQKTYRVTVGDVVEGFRILRKDANKVYLSKEGILYEINLD